MDLFEGGIDDDGDNRSSGNAGNSSSSANRSSFAGGSAAAADGTGAPCGCGTPSVRKLVRKEGPTKGKAFWCCPKPQNEGCGFFDWVKGAPAADVVRASAAWNGVEAPNNKKRKLEDGGSASGGGGSSEGEEAPVMCKHNKPAAQKKVNKEGKNKDRVFFCCCLSYNDPEKCDFFMWLDDVEKKKKGALPPPSETHVVMHDTVYRPPDEKKKDPEQNAHDEDGSCLKRGQLAEELFMRLARARGFTATAVSPFENIYLHRDIHIRRGPYNKEEFFIDVKAAKKLKRSDAALMYDKLWLEMHSVRPNDAGWIIAGQSQMIAFEVENGFLLLARKALWKFIDTQVPKDQRAHRSEDAEGKTYQRHGRHDMMTLASVKTLLKWDEEEKEKNERRTKEKAEREAKEKAETAAALAAGLPAPTFPKVDESADWYIKLVVDRWVAPENIMAEYRAKVAEALAKEDAPRQ